MIDLQVNDDTVNSEAKLHGLFLKWLSFNDHHFDVEDEKAFKERFENFKDTAQFVNKWNKSGYSSTFGLNPFSDLTCHEFATCSWKIYPKKPSQVMDGKAEYQDKKLN
ncbi:hypothetical protein MKW98_000270 [Papaver atlanticum]|uniref:Cathepsin propeptide inhibitor domain-containing protein n=1 Tax=Papaver atlanticum TaxID=357466 RepID=A0AAD4X6X4_9MAGN|nr:hypothetical protein MKW98_000270 [Papaver atlanticum]